MSAVVSLEGYGLASSRGEGRMARGTVPRA